MRQSGKVCSLRLKLKWNFFFLFEQQPTCKFDGKNIYYFVRRSLKSLKEGAAAAAATAIVAVGRPTQSTTDMKVNSLNLIASTRQHIKRYSRREAERKKEKTIEVKLLCKWANRAGRQKWNGTSSNNERCTKQRNFLDYVASFLGAHVHCEQST